MGRESKVRTVDEEGDLWASMSSKGEKTQMQQLVTPRSAAKNEPNNFTRISRTGSDSFYSVIEVHLCNDYV